MNKTHRTALILYAAADDPAYQERAVRLLESVNNTGIKVDSYTVFKNEGGDPMVYGQVPLIPASSELVCEFADLHTELAAAGYDMIVHAHSRHLSMNIGVDNLTPVFHEIPDGDLQKKLETLDQMYQEYKSQAMKEAGLDDDEIHEFLHGGEGEEDNGE